MCPKSSYLYFHMDTIETKPVSSASTLQSGTSTRHARESINFLQSTSKKYDKSPTNHLTRFFYSGLWRCSNQKTQQFSCQASWEDTKKNASLLYSFGFILPTQNQTHNILFFFICFKTFFSDQDSSCRIVQYSTSFGFKRLWYKQKLLLSVTSQASKIHKLVTPPETILIQKFLQSMQLTLFASVERTQNQNTSTSISQRVRRSFIKAGNAQSP